ncbi:MAG: hypothetical protein ACREKF_01810 [Candidatus Methylomirabilales bacterium]
MSLPNQASMTGMTKAPSLRSETDGKTLYRIADEIENLIQQVSEQAFAVRNASARLLDPRPSEVRGKRPPAEPQHTFEARLGIIACMLQELRDDLAETAGTLDRAV